MTISPSELRKRDAPERGDSARFVRAGRSEILVATLVVCIGVFMLVATARMDVTSTVNYLGPRFFPAAIGGLLVVLGAALAIRVYLRTRPGNEVADAEDAPVEQDSSAGQAVETSGTGSTSPSSDWKPLGLTLASLVAHVLLLQTAGWIIAGALLFWGVSYALGSRKVLRDLGISFIVSCAVQVAFSVGLGLTLPPGLLIGLF